MPRFTGVDGATFPLSTVPGTGGTWRLILDAAPSPLGVPAFCCPYCRGTTSLLQMAIAADGSLGATLRCLPPCSFTATNSKFGGWTYGVKPAGYKVSP